MNTKTDKEKARAYDEAIEKLRGLLEGVHEEKCDIMEEDIIKIFPELKEKESKDERIRKSLAAYFAKFKPDDMWVSYCSFGDIVAWLEKQGEQKLIDKIQLGKMYKCIASPRYSTFVKGLIYVPQDKFLCSLMNFCSDCFEPIEDGEQKPTDKVKPKFKVGDIVKSISQPMREPRKIISIGKDCYWCEDRGCIGFAWEDDCELVEQKPKFRIGDTIKKESTGDIVTISEIDLKNREYRLSNTGFIPFKYEYLWELVEQKPAWSEEDNINCNRLLYFLNGGNLMQDHKIELFIWVESLKDRYTWKPSEKQIKALKDSIEFLGCTKKVREDLKSLYEQLTLVSIKFR